MKYMGSKNRHAKYIIPIVTRNRKSHQWYVEPFVGGFNLIDKITGNRLANDSNEYLIALFRAIQAGWTPPDFVSEQEYSDIKNNNADYPNYLVGFVGFGCSYAGKWFGGYARGVDTKGKDRNYTLESKKNILKQYNGIQGICIENKSYLDIVIPTNSIIYCDPPYLNTTNYKDKFDHTIFWEWVRQQTYSGHRVFVSEYTAPQDFVCVWEKEVNNTLVKNTGSKSGIERLFVHESQFI